MNKLLLPLKTSLEESLSWNTCSCRALGSPKLRVLKTDGFEFGIRSCSRILKAEGLENWGSHCFLDILKNWGSRIWKTDGLELRVRQEIELLFCHTSNMHANISGNNTRARKHKWNSSHTCTCPCRSTSVCTSACIGKHCSHARGKQVLEFELLLPDEQTITSLELSFRADV